MITVSVEKTRTAPVSRLRRLLNIFVILASKTAVADLFRRVWKKTVFFLNRFIMRCYLDFDTDSLLQS